MLYIIRLRVEKIWGSSGHCKVIASASVIVIAGAVEYVPKTMICYYAFPKSCSVQLALPLDHQVIYRRLTCPLIADVSPRVSVCTC